MDASVFQAITHLLFQDVVIVSFARTPIGKFGGDMSGLSGPKLGAVAVREAVAQAGIDPALVQETFMGNVVGAGSGQAPARQAVIYGGLPVTVPCTTINKVCASGMKAVMLAAQGLSLGPEAGEAGGVVVAGGFESMSNVPYYLLQARKGYRLGNGTLVDGVVHDGLWDVYDDHHMGVCAELCAEKYGLGREDQDLYASRSYARAADAWQQASKHHGKFDQEVVPVEVPQRKGDPLIISRDEEFTNIDLVKLPSLRPAFKGKGGTVTAANASSLNDGAAAMVLMTHA
ncbi:unnamed protein product, partial [Choristocarpus tenellus]